MLSKDGLYKSYGEVGMNSWLLQINRQRKVIANRRGRCQGACFINV
jgi:hypothetical protein